MSRIILTFNFILFSVWACAQPQTGLQIELKFKKDTFEFLEPWRFSVEFTNIGQSDLNVALSSSSLNGSAGTEIKLERKDMKSNQWVDTDLISSICNSDLRINALFKPSQTRSYKFETAPPIQIEGITGEVTLRASFSIVCNGPDSLKYFSAPVIVKILELPKLDSAAFKYLISTFRKPQMVFFPMVPVGYDTVNCTNAEYILNHFPESVIADYCRLHLSALYTAKANFKASSVGQFEPESTLFYLRKAKKNGLEALASKNPDIVELAELRLSSLFLTLLMIYDPWPPDEIVSEFEFDFRDK